MIPLIFQIYIVYSYLLFSLVPIDSFWIVRPLLLGIISVIFVFISKYINYNLAKGRKKINFLIVSTLLFICLIIIGEFGKINRPFIFIVSGFISIATVILIRYKLFTLITVISTLFLLVTTSESIINTRFDGIKSYGFNEPKTFNSSKVYSGKRGLSSIYDSFQWGFEDDLPIRGRYYFISSNKPKGIVFILHGNHLAEDDSHKGYDYLLKHLGDNGFIGVSVDQNFLNGDWTNLGVGLPFENDTRAHLLLSHIDYFSQLNSSIESELYNQIDIKNIALIGHSRGGEAVAIAGSLDERIKTVVALAPTFGQYSSSVYLKDVDYLVIQGTSDGDLRRFRGLEQFKRTKRGNKASLLLEDFNHSGFNSDWGSYDGTGPGNLFYSRGKSINPQLQQNITKELVYNFICYSLKGDELKLKKILDKHRINNSYGTYLEDEILHFTPQVIQPGKVYSVTNKSKNKKFLNISAYNPVEDLQVLKIQDVESGNIYYIELQPALDWDYLRLNFIQKKRQRGMNYHTYQIELPSNWSKLVLSTDSDKSIFINRITTSHQKIE